MSDQPEGRGNAGRRILSAAVVLILLSGFLTVNTACGRTAPASQPVETLNVVTSFLPMYIFTANLIQGIDGITLENLAAPETGCLHDYRLTPADLVKLESAELFIINGAGMEGYLADLALQDGDLPIIEASAGIELLKSNEDAENPHVWLSVRLAILQVKNISRGLQQAAPELAAQIRANETVYCTRLQALHERILAELSRVGQRDIITFHEAFPYFASEYGLHIAAVIEREPGSEPSAFELAETIDLIRDLKITAIFAEPQYPLAIAETIARETEAKVHILDPVVTGTLAPDTYEKAMEQNLQVLLAALH